MTNSEREKVLEFVDGALIDLENFYGGGDESDINDARSALREVVEILQPQPTEDTVEVRACCILDEDGNWVVIGNSNARHDYHTVQWAKSICPTGRPYPDHAAIDPCSVAWITARVPRPMSTEIEGEVQRVE
jgi:hypothetical protein